jgi:hypothetical protein
MARITLTASKSELRIWAPINLPELIYRLVANENMDAYLVWGDGQIC